MLKNSLQALDDILEVNMDRCCSEVLRRQMAHRRSTPFINILYNLAKWLFLYSLSFSSPFSFFSIFHFFLLAHRLFFCFSLYFCFFPSSFSSLVYVFVFLYLK